MCFLFVKIIPHNISMISLIFEFPINSSSFFNQHYAKEGLKTCLVTHSLDLTTEYLLNCKIGTTPVICNDNLSAVRLETTKVCIFLHYLFCNQRTCACPFSS